jgi:hypothetical protein
MVTKPGTLEEFKADANDAVHPKYKGLPAGLSAEMVGQRAVYRQPVMSKRGDRVISTFIKK